MDLNPRLAVIGGSGLYAMPGLKNSEEHDLDTPFGRPSAPIVVGELEGLRVAFLARHGIGHAITPSEVNYRANIFALKSLGVERIVSISACGSLREDYIPGEIVIPDQLFDFTRGRIRTFFGEGLVAHISVADPFCADFSQILARAVEETEAIHHQGGAMITIEGPRFSTRAEFERFSLMGHGADRDDDLTRGIPGARSRDLLRGDGSRDRLRRLACQRRPCNRGDGHRYPEPQHKSCAAGGAKPGPILAAESRVQL